MQIESNSYLEFRLRSWSYTKVQSIGWKNWRMYLRVDRVVEIELGSRRLWRKFHDDSKDWTNVHWWNLHSSELQWNGFYKLNCFWTKSVCIEKYEVTRTRWFGCFPCRILNHFRANVPNKTFNFDLQLPVLEFKGDYAIALKLLIKISGTGKFVGSFSEDLRFDQCDRFENKRFDFYPQRTHWPRS